MGTRITETDPPRKPEKKLYKLRCLDCGRWVSGPKLKKVVKVLAKHREQEHGQKK